jgi:integrase
VKKALPKPLPLDEWPQLDQVAWRQALDGDPLAPGGGGAAAAWRPSTARQNAIQYGGWLAWLQDAGLLDEAESPAKRADRKNVRLYLDALEAAGLADYSRAGRLQGLGNVLRVIDPTEDVRFLGRAAGRIASGAKRARDLNPRLRPPIEVLRLGLDLMASAEDPDSGLPEADRAYAFRDGLLIALWANRALRVANLAAIELDRTLLRVGGRHRMVFDHDEMKGARPFSCMWPPKLEAALQRYLETYRPCLLRRSKAGSEDRALWISQFGTGMPSGSIGQIIYNRTRARFGEALNPHLMRYILATFYAEHEPEQIADVAAMLHHADLETSEEHYILANSMKAIGKFQEAVLSRRRTPAA